MNLATLAERNLAEYGEYERLVSEGVRKTNRELHDASCRLAGALADLGLDCGDRVVVIMPNCPEVLLAYPAIWRAGMTVIPVFFRIEARELEAILKNSRAKAIITSSDMHRKITEATQRLDPKPLVIMTVEGDGVPAGCLSLGEIVATHEPLRAIVPRSRQDVAALLYTSGTTSRPKGVIQTHGNLYASALNAWNGAGCRSGDTTLFALPLAHSFGLAALLSGYLSGNRAVLMRRFDPGKALELIQRYQLRAMAGVPTMFIDMLRHPMAQAYDTSSMERWFVGGAPMPTDQQREFEKSFTGIMYDGYGLSESCSGLAAQRDGMPRKAGSCGPPLPGVLLKIVDEAGVEVPRGQTGEICAKGANISPGYYEDAAATAEAFRDGWLYTGDIGYLDADGYLFVIDRRKDLIIRGGLNVYPNDVEDVIRQHPVVLDASVVGVPDTRVGEEVCAYITRRPGADISGEDVIGYCQATLANYKVPRYVEFVDVLPKNHVGKVNKKALRQLAALRFGHG